MMGQFSFMEISMESTCITAIEPEAVKLEMTENTVVKS
jgi:hypothetical protein